MTEEHPNWSVESVLLAVRDLDRSASFYQDVMHLREVLREDRIAALVDDANGSFTLFLRGSYPNRGALRPGPEALGVRSLTFRVGSASELDRVEARLRTENAFRDRLSVGAGQAFDVVRGWDPDRFPLNVMLKHQGEQPSLEQFRAAVAEMYSLDA